MAQREHGYKKTEVSGTRFKIKEKHEGSDLSSVGRRLAARDYVNGVTVEYDGTINIHVRHEETWTIGDVVPDGFSVVGGMMHTGWNSRASAHLDIACDE